MNQLLAVYDPSGKLGLTDPSPGGGKVSLRWRCSACGHITERRSKDGTCWRRARSAPVLAACGGDQLPILLLRTEDGTVDPIGMARAREVLARVMGLIGEGEGVCMSPVQGYYGASPSWVLRSRAIKMASRQACEWRTPRPPGESAPEALARLLAERAGCEVIRG